MIDLDRIRVRGKKHPEAIVNNTKRIFCSPWDSISFWKDSAPTGQTVYVAKIPKAPKRYRVSIGAIFASAFSVSIGLPAQFFIWHSIYILDIRRLRLSVTIPPGYTVDSEGIIATFADQQPENAVDGARFFANLRESWFPDGLLMKPDQTIAVQYITNGQFEPSLSVWYRYEEWI